ncbi:PIN/TRAM domain-containing protein [Thermogemmata fonticola]|uniref:TRAM domain-containing protein n=1 Tax=Thermogemmata fonticola TaxID=2755323 RepID=A0A7V8VF24_9BACT|nr:PIN domain-containing protein [Thermogemmata fonticola]MBA2226858.1 TRAM domain-containing protein [Thermogemmata fonticola]
MLLPLLRITFGILVVGLTAYAASLFIEREQTGVALLVSAVTLGAGALVLITDLREKQKKITTISAIYFGLLLGLLVGWLISIATAPLLEFAFPNERRMVQIGQVFITVISCYIAISTLLQTKDEFRFIIPYVEFSKQVKGGRPLVLDTSVIIDGRIADICDTRLIDTKLIVPRFVLQELQAIADSSDRLKRNRGRRGLDILKRLQTNPKIELEMHDGNVPELRTGERIRVDERLVILAKALNARVVTNDFNLNKIAQLQGVDVINLNELANALKTVALPGETMTVRVVKPGDQIGQGVGYLDDGTMVVVEQGRPYIGQETTIVVTSVLQTPAGRMIFGRPDQRLSGTTTPYPGGGSSGSSTSNTRSGDSTASHVSLGNKGGEAASGGTGSGTPASLGHKPGDSRTGEPPRSPDESR